MAISANTLFHFTSIERLSGILRKGGFYCQYSDEHFENILPINSQHRFSYIPMTSFCDLTIMQLSNDSVHRKSFGEFGIGLKKEWGITNGVSPVMYVHRRSQQTRRLHRLIKEIKDFRKLDDVFSSISEIEDELVDSFKYIKPYRGYWHKGKKVNKALTYYNEREWRYCPLLSEHNVLSANISENKGIKEKLNIDLKKKLLHFKPEEIKFIILKDKDSIPDIVAVIGKMKISKAMKNVLVTKIITFEEIREDF